MCRLTKARDEEIELVIERLENEKEELMSHNQKESQIKVDEILEEKLELQKQLKDYESRFAEISNTAVLVNILCVSV